MNFDVKNLEVFSVPCNKPFLNKIEHGVKRI